MINNVLTKTDRLNLFSHKRLFLLSSLLLFVLLLNPSFSGIAKAAPVTYSTSTDVTLSDNGTILHIVSGSVADEVTVGASSLTVTVSATTGGNFYVTSTDGLATTPDNSGVAKSCSGGVASVTVSGPGTYALSKAAAICSTQVSGGYSGGSSPTVVSSPAPSPAPAPTPLTTTTTVVTVVQPVVQAPTALSAQQQLLNTLIASLKLLLQQASSQGIKLPVGAEAYLTPASLVNIKDASRNLYVGAVGDDVKSLQEFLNSHGFAVAASGPGSSGSETTKFGGLTKAALAKFQKSVGISPASGMFGPLTRSYIKNNY